jgi:hypothetical protein
MKKVMLFAAAVVLMPAFSAWAGGECKCPMMVKGAKVEVKSVEKGVTITITSEDPTAVKEIRTKAAHMEKAGCPCPKGDCPCAKGEKGDCPCAKGDCPCAGGDCGKGQAVRSEGRCPMMQGDDPFAGGSCNCPMMQGGKK